MNEQALMNAYVAKLKAKLDEVMNVLVLTEARLHVVTEEMSTQKKSDAEQATEADRVRAQMNQVIGQLELRAENAETEVARLRGDCERLGAELATVKSLYGEASDSLVATTRELENLKASGILSPPAAKTKK